LKLFTPARIATLLLLLAFPDQSQAQTNVLLSENFEDGILDSRISITSWGSFNSPPAIRNRAVLGSPRAFGYGKSTCGANCYWGYVSCMTITFPGGTNVSQLSFKGVEVDGDWGNGGQVYLDPPHLPVLASDIPLRVMDFCWPSPASNTFVVPVERKVTNIVLLVDDITYVSEIYIDDLVILGASGAAIATQPQGQVSCLGGSGTFCVAATGAEPLKYQWYQASTLLTGQTNSCLTLMSLQASQAGLYSVVVTNAFGSVTSAPAQLVVNDACVGICMYAGLTIAGQAGSNYVLKCTTDLGITNFADWTPLATNTMTSSNWFYLDMESCGSPRRFYGVKLLP
jgi:hypothetical protein